MTDNPIEVQEEIERAFTRLAKAYAANMPDPLSPDTGEEVASAESALRTAILKHDPVVTALAKSAEAAHWMGHRDGQPRDTCGAAACRALEAYRTVVSEGHGGE